MLNLNAIIWSANPDFFVIPGLDHPIRWYGLLFALGFVLGQLIFQYIYRVENKPKKDLEQLLIYVVAGTVVGARLGHCLFYDPSYYLSHPIEILFVWKGGLASHGGALGLFTSLYLYARTRKDQPYLWLLDRMVIIVAVAGTCIRTGNFMNSEIIGKATESDFGVVFARDFEQLLLNSSGGVDEVSFKRLEGQQGTNGNIPMEVQVAYKRGENYKKESIENHYRKKIQNDYVSYSSLKEHILLPNGSIEPRISQKKNQFIVSFPVYGVARHPAQLYEAIYCVIIFLLLFHIWYHHRHQLNDGFLFGLFMAILFTLRFIDEFFKENQVAFEDGMSLNMGQILSIPFVAVGIFFMARSFLINKELQSQNGA